jgi:hypothetical protein
VALTSGLATREDLPALGPLVEAAIEELQKGFLDDAQIRSSHAIMGIGTMLIDDGTYFVVELDGQVAAAVGAAGPRSTVATTLPGETRRCLIRPATRPRFGRCIPIPRLPAEGLVA